MKMPYSFFLAATVLLSVGLAQAQGQAEEASEQHSQLKEHSEAEFSQRMKEAEERLAEAARRVAELSTRRLEAYGDGGMHTMEFSSKPRIGINIETDGDEGPVDGVGVVSVTPGSAADDAGMRAGDIITTVNGESLKAETKHKANARLLDFMRGVEEGDRLKIEYRRDGKAGSLELEPRVLDSSAFVWSQDGKHFAMPRMPDIHVLPEVAGRLRYSFGGWKSGWGDLELVELSKGLGRYFGSDSGMLVISAPESNEFKLQEGDVIQSIDGRTPNSVDHCMRIFTSYQPGETMELQIMRDKRRLTIKVEVPDRRTSALPTLPESLWVPAIAPLPGVPLPRAAPAIHAAPVAPVAPRPEPAKQCT